MENTIVEVGFSIEKTPVRLGPGKETVLKFMNAIIKVFHQNYTLTECNPPYHNWMRVLFDKWITSGEKIEIACVGPLSVQNETRREMRTHEFIGLKQNGLFTRADLWRSSQATARRQGRNFYRRKNGVLRSLGLILS